MQGQKHLIKCRCILPHFKNQSDPTPHHFIVFSEINDDDSVNVKFAQCNNCGIVHKVTDVCKSEILHNKEFLRSIVSIDDIRPTLHPNLIGILEKNEADIATWEFVKFIIDNKKWGQHVILTSESEDGMRVGKILVILGESLFNVNSFTKDEII
jgi:hypothetical protein